ATGSIDYDPAYESVFSGRDGKKLTVRGLPFSIDAAATSYETYTVTGVVPDAIARTQSPVLHLLPGPHFLAIPGVGVSNQFSITPAGRIDYEPVYDKTFAGRGSTTLTVNGLPVEVDAKSTTFARFAIPGVTEPVDARQAHSFQLLPGTHQVAPSAGTTITFGVTPAGNVDYDTSLDDVLDGRDTPKLRFRGPQWGYV